MSAAATLSARHAAERLDNCWHGGALTLDQLKQDMATLLQVGWGGVGRRGVGPAVAFIFVF